jgi:hypothetical protein
MANIFKKKLGKDLEKDTIFLLYITLHKHVQTLNHKEL